MVFPRGALPCVVSFYQVLRWLLSNVPMVVEIVPSPAVDAFAARLIELVRAKTEQLTANNQVLFEHIIVR